jgi:uncharacterized coiled-coil protein SlyX
MTVTNSDLAERMERLDVRMEYSEDRLDTIDKTVAELSRGMGDLRTAVAAQSRTMDQALQIVADTRDVVEAWNTVKGAGRFLRWTGGVLQRTGGVIAAAAAAVAGIIAVMISWKELR